MNKKNKWDDEYDSEEFYIRKDDRKKGGIRRHRNNNEDDVAKYNDTNENSGPGKG